MGRRLVYIAIGNALGVLIAYAAGLIFHWRIVWQIPFLAGTLLGSFMVQWAERKGKVETVATIRRPFTLFSPEDRKG